MDTSFLSVGYKDYLIGIPAGSVQRAVTALVVRVRLAHSQKILYFGRSRDIYANRVRGGDHDHSAVWGQRTNRFAMDHMAKLGSRPLKVPSRKKASNNL